jgi:PAS domain S-box-containing protein
MQSALKSLIDKAPGLLLISDARLRCQAASAELEALLGVGADSGEGKPLAEYLPGSSSIAVCSAVEQVLTTGEPVVGGEVAPDDSDGLLAGAINAWPVGESGEPRLVAVRIRPESGGPELESRLHELSDLHETILNAAGDGIYGLDADGRTTFVNRAATELLGWKSSDILGKRLHDIHHHSHEDGSPYSLEECEIFASLRDGQVHFVEQDLFWTADGSPMPVEYSSTPIEKGGQTVGAVVVFRDIRERLRIENERANAFDELEAVKRQLEMILDAAGEGIYGLDRDGNGTLVNKAAVDLLGWRVEDVLGHGVHEMHHHKHADGRPYPREECPVYAALKDGDIHRVDSEVFWSSDGVAIPVEYTSTPILADDGRPDGAVVVFRDITERKKIERERDDAFAEIRDLNSQLEQERDYLREEVQLTVNFGEIVGESTALKRTLQQIEAVAATPVNVLILGESGVGKEMIARAIHSASDRSAKALVRVNCASIPKDLFESEFFGHIKGAYTGAHRDRVGRMQLADGGTLFLDEVGEIPLSLQSKLLRALQESQFERVGDDKTITVDVRIVAATNKDLKAEVEAGRFREDLFYRLSVFPVEVPPLRERKEDIVPLAAHFISSFCKELGREPLAITKRQADLLKGQRWSGNIRELKNVMERAVILSHGKRLSLDLSSTDSGGSVDVSTSRMDVAGFVTEGEFRELEKNNLIGALRQAGWRISGPGGAAELLDIKPSTLAYRMKAFNITEEKYSTP